MEMHLEQYPENTELQQLGKRDLGLYGVGV